MRELKAKKEKIKELIEQEDFCSLKTMLSNADKVQVLNIFASLPRNKQTIILKLLDSNKDPKSFESLHAFDNAINTLEDQEVEDICNSVDVIETTDCEESRSNTLINGNIFKIWMVRVPILMITLFLGMLTGLVIDGFEDVLSAIVGVAVFIPVIMAMGGNIGTQSATIFARGVVLGQININKFMKPFLKEVFVGFSIGLLSGILAGIASWLWQGVPNGIPALGIAVGLAMIVTMTVATLLGYLVPFILIKLNIDQAAGAAPIITTLKDVVALFVYFGSVSLFLSHMFL